jgi:hypothetical protein
MPAEVTAKIEGFSIMFVVERGGFIHVRSTNWVLGCVFRFIHGRVSFWVVITPAEVVKAGLFLGNPPDHDHQPRFSTAVYNMKADQVLLVFKARNRDGICPMPRRLRNRVEFQIVAIMPPGRI